MSQVKVKVPFGTKVVLVPGSRYEADPYGFIYCSEKDAEMICKDPAYRKDGKRDGVVDVTKADPIGTQISQLVAAKSQQAEQKMNNMESKQA